MRPRKTQMDGSGDLFRAQLDQIINMDHALARLADEIDWDWIDSELAGLFSEQGRPGTPTRYMIGLLLLKQIYGLSDEAVCERWVHDPYFQHFTGETFFQHALPHERSGLTHWRQRIGEKLELLLQESLRVAHDLGALKKSDLGRVTVDTTVQPKNVTHPTDAKLMLKAITELGKLARQHGVRLRQSYVRVAKRAALMAGRYAHAKQFKRCNRELRFLRNRLGRFAGLRGPAGATVLLTPRHRTQDRRRRGAGGDLCRAPRQGLPDPPPAPAAAWPQDLFLACPRDGVYRQGQGAQAL